MKISDPGQQECSVVETLKSFERKIPAQECSGLDRDEGTVEGRVITLYNPLICFIYRIFRGNLDTLESTHP